MAELKDANTNPWYVLMTLYGEQTGEAIDWELHEKNRAAWNAWSCQNLTADEAKEVARTSRVDLAEVQAWREIADDVTARHESEMKKRNGADFDYVGMPDVEKSINYSQMQFFNTVVLQHCIFTQAAYFSHATFTQDARFAEATFTQDAHFSDATFTQAADFFRATFTQAANFYGARFTQAADFSHATFTQAADFSDAQFARSVNFRSATLNGFGRFQRARFLKVPQGEIAGDEDSVKIDFTDCHFEKSTSFREAVFEERYPILVGAVLHQNTDFSADGAYWPSALHQDPAEARESCAKIRHAVGKQGLPEDEHFFFRREMTFAGQVGTWLDRLPYRVFGSVSDYGHSILRPAIWLGIFWIVPALFYTYAFEWMLIMDGNREIALDGFGLSFANIFKFFGFQRTYYDVDEIQTLAGGLQLMGAAQTVVGFILLFFLGLGLRTRFRMR